jgi:hypothetical protein
VRRRFAANFADLENTWETGACYSYSMKYYLSVVVLAALTVATGSAQSLSINSPAPLKAGVNESQTDNFTGTHYWYFYGGPGKVSVHCEFKGAGLLGASMAAPLTFTLSDAAQTWHISKKLVSGSTADQAQTTFPGTLKKRTKIIVTVAPIAGGLVRTGGQYDISVSGAVAYGEDKAGDPIVQTFMQESGMTSNYGATKFKADGSVLASTGATGTWKLFDADTHTYVVVLDGQRLSLIYMPGRGLVSADDPNNVVFKALK